MTKSADCEATGLNILKGDRPFMFALFNDADSSARQWSWSVNPFTRSSSIPSSDLDEIAHECEGEDLVFSNAIFDLRAMASVGLTFSFEWPIPMIFPPGKGATRKQRVVKCGALHDTQLLSHAAYSPGAGGKHDLKSLAFYYLEYIDDDEKALHKATVAARRLGKQLGWKLGVDHKGAAEVEADYWMPRAAWEYMIGDANDDDYCCPESWETICAKYNIGDVERSLGLYHFLMELLDSPEVQTSYERELRLLPVTYRMEHAGMYTSRKRLSEELSKFSATTTRCKATAEKLIEEETHLPTNVNSPLQLEAWLNAIDVKPTSYTATGLPSTGVKELINLAQYCESERHPSPNRKHCAQVLRWITGWSEEHGDDRNSPGYKTYESGVSYLTNYQQRLIGDYFHPSYNQSGTKFTRYSSSGAQNVSKKAVLPLRKVFGPPPGYLWLDPDYSQLELRIFAYASGDESMIEAFQLGYDFHEFTATRLYHLSPGEVTKEQRRFAKSVNFKAIYGGLNNVPPIYAKQFPKAAEFMAKVVRDVQQFGYIHTLQGDRIYIDPEKAYVGVDAICQGTAGRIVKEAMRMCHEQGLVDWEGSKIVGNIHDEIIFEISLEYPVAAIAKRIKQVMELAGQHAGVVTPVDMSVTFDNWAETTPLKTISPKTLKPALRRSIA